MRTEHAGLHEVIAMVAALRARALTHVEFSRQAEKFVNKELAPEVFRAVCDETLANGSVRGDKVFEAEVYAFRAATHWLDQDIENARNDARNAVARDAYSVLALQVLYNVHAARGKTAKAASVLEKLARAATDRAERYRLAEQAKELSLRAGAMDCAELLRAFQDNEPEANMRYAGHSLAVTGTVRETTRSSLGWPKIVLEGASGGPALSCLFDPDANAELESLAVGGEIMVSGYNSGLVDGLVNLRGCRVMNMAWSPGYMADFFQEAAVEEDSEDA